MIATRGVPQVHNGQCTASLAGEGGALVTETVLDHRLACWGSSALTIVGLWNTSSGNYDLTMLESCRKHADIHAESMLNP